MMFGSDIFSSLFGGSTKEDSVGSNLLTRINDLERVVATKDESAVDRIIARHRRHSVRDEDIEEFEEAWRGDLEWAYLRRIHEKEEEESAYKPDGKRSLAAAHQGYVAVREGRWEWAKTHFAQARSYHGEHWSQSEKVVEKIVIHLNLEPEFDADEHLAENIFKSFEVVDDERDGYLRESTQVKSPLEWMETLYKVSNCSRALGGFITEELLEVARGGRWKEWISVSQKGGHSTTYEEVEKRQSDDTIVVVSPKGMQGARDKTKLGKYIATFKGDPHLESQTDRLWSIFWWACDFWPNFNTYRKYTPTKKADEKWYLIDTYERGLGAPSYKFETVTQVYEKLPDGYESKEALRVSAWRQFIFG